MDRTRLLSLGRYMSRVALLIMAIALSAVAETSAEVKRFEAFRQEVTALERAVACRGRLTPAGDGLGALYGCMKGRAETAKLFVNERAGTEQVENVKIMWNDWFQDRGHGIHADRGEAAQILAGALSRYAPRNTQKITDAFFANAAMTFKEGAFTLTYRYRRGPAIDERLLIITQQ